MCVNHIDAVFPRRPLNPLRLTVIASVSLPDFYDRNSAHACGGDEGVIRFVLPDECSDDGWMTGSLQSGGEVEHDGFRTAGR